MQQEIMPLTDNGELATNKSDIQARLFENIQPQSLSLREKTAIFELARQLAVHDYEDKFLTSAGQTSLMCLGYLRGAEEERFAVVFLTSQNQVMKIRQFGTGTINQSAVFPREIARSVLMLNAASVILMHNHPSGLREPSSADRHITDAIVDALALFDVRVLDHIIVANERTYSFAEHGLL